MAPVAGIEGRPSSQRAGAPGRRPSSAIAAVVDVRACSAPRMRALAERLGGRPVAVIGTSPEADRAARQGLRVVAACAPLLGAVALSAGALRRSLGRLPIDGSLLVLGPRAREAARTLGVRSAAPDDPPPAPRSPLPRTALRQSWGVRDGECVVLLVASPAAACDARAALDVVGRTAIAGGPVALVVHPSAGELPRAQALAAAEDGSWRLVRDERAEEPELLSGAVDAALVVERRMEPVPAARGASGFLAAFVRGGAAPHVLGDALGARLAVRAGIPTVVAAGTAAASVVAPECVFDPRRPNVGARLLQAIRSAASR